LPKDQAEIFDTQCCAVAKERVDPINHILTIGT
jgi:hypothetical protein